MRHAPGGPQRRLFRLDLQIEEGIKEKKSFAKREQSKRQENQLEFKFTKQAQNMKILKDNKKIKNK